MSSQEVFPENVLPKLEGIPAEQSRLIRIQAAHEWILNECGITIHATNTANTGTFNDLTQVSVALHDQEKSDGTPIKVPTIHLRTTRVNEETERVETDIKPVAVANINTINGEMEAKNGFEIYEAQLVMGMLGELERVVKAGELPHLSKNMGWIEDPSAQQSYLPRVDFEASIDNY